MEPAARRLRAQPRDEGIYGFPLILGDVAELKSGESLVHARSKVRGQSHLQAFVMVDSAGYRRLGVCISTNRRRFVVLELFL